MLPWELSISAQAEIGGISGPVRKGEVAMTDSTTSEVVEGRPTDEPERHRRIRVKVFVPSQVKGKIFTWVRTKLVGEAAAEAAAAFGIHGWTPSFQNDERRVLDREKTLGAEGVEDNDKLELVDVGGGV